MKQNMLMIVFGIIMVIIALVIMMEAFPEVIDSAETVRSTANVSEYMALETSVEAGPTMAYWVLLGAILFTGLGSSVAGTYGAIRTARGRRK